MEHSSFRIALIEFPTLLLACVTTLPGFLTAVVLLAVSFGSAYRYFNTLWAMLLVGVGAPMLIAFVIFWIWVSECNVSAKQANGKKP